MLPFSIDPIVEEVIDRLELRLRYGRRFERERAKPLVVMTQRSRLDAFLAEQAAAAGADFRDGARATTVAVDERGATVQMDGRRVRAEVVIGADGANGVSARCLGLCTRPAYGVALEGNVGYDAVEVERFQHRIAFELGVVRGGYGWVFPKAGHLNVGVGGRAREAPALRRHLVRLCRERGIPHARLERVRGYRLPVCRPGAVVARGRGLVVGDAAGVVDPLTGDGIYEAFVSATLAADATIDVLAGRVESLDGYNDRMRRRLGHQRSNAWAAKVALESFPRLMFTVARSELVQSALESLARDEPAAAGTSRLARAFVAPFGTLARAIGDAGHALATR
jgi:geranylgeranyl reductase family protein